MICPNCGALMNPHAEKPVKTIQPEEVITAIYCCPACGKVEAREEIEGR